MQGMVKDSCKSAAAERRCEEESQRKTDELIAAFEEDGLPCDPLFGQAGGEKSKKQKQKSNSKRQKKARASVVVSVGCV